MTSAEATSTPQPTAAVVTVHPLLGVLGVLLGAMIATGTGRLISVGLADIHSVLHLGVDEAAWISMAFSGVLCLIVIACMERNQYRRVVAAAAKTA